MWRDYCIHQCWKTKETVLLNHDSSKQQVLFQRIHSLWWLVVQEGAKSDNSMQRKETRTAVYHLILRNLYCFMGIQRPWPSWSFIDVSGIVTEIQTRRLEPTSVRNAIQVSYYTLSLLWLEARRNNKCSLNVSPWLRSLFYKRKLFLRFARVFTQRCHFWTGQRLPWFSSPKLQNPPIPVPIMSNSAIDAIMLVQVIEPESRLFLQTARKFRLVRTRDHVQNGKFIRYLVAFTNCNRPNLTFVWPQPASFITFLLIQFPLLHWTRSL